MNARGGDRKVLTMEPVNVVDLDLDGIKKFLDSFDHVFSDCDGVIWNTMSPLPDSGRFFQLMKQFGKSVYFVSNNSLRSQENYEAKFEAAGIHDGFKNLTVPSIAIAEYLKSINFNKKVFCVTCPETISVMKSHGIQCEEGPHDAPSYYADYLPFIQDDEEIGAVVFDTDFRINMPKMYKAITYLKRPDVLYINGATDRHFSLKPGTLCLAGGIFTDIVSKEVNREPIVLGKPSKEFGEFAMRRAGVTDASRVLFIGDMIDPDIGLGKVTGFQTLLVLTSITKENMLAHPTILPDYYATSLGSLVPLLSKFC